ncbi:MAG: sialate O-acetylesterase [Planctomycetaceae bacterium]|jgi:sialate O-acetylesterase|nr:sialate O-acetylesterase [Planctomycetaceae bacterium]
MKQLKWGSLLFLTALLVCSATLVYAEVKTPAIFSDNMVLQRDLAVPVWGWADAGEKVTVTFNGQTKETVAGENGKWSVKLDAAPAGGPYELTVAGSNTIAFKNVALGDVWVCSGQSNMEWQVKNVIKAEGEIQEANYPNIRFITVPKKSVNVPQDNFQGSWVPCSPQTVPGFTAVGYFFGRELHQATDVAIGLIHTSWGGSSCETWIPEGIVGQYDIYKSILERRAAHLEKNPNGGDNQQAGYLYNGMIAPILPYGIKGAIWYQGESNAGRAYQYRTLFPLMISTWRELWEQGDFPFYFVQLANFGKNGEPLGASAWAELREAQALTLNLRKTGYAVTIDIGTANDIHPRNKQDVGARLARWSLAKDYGKTIPVYTGPIFNSFAIQGGKATVGFDFAQNGLKTQDGGKVAGFIIAGADRKFVAADAVIDGGNVIVSSPEIANPVAVRYAWANDPGANLFNAENLPAAPFRTDDWPGVTINNK